MLITIGTAAGIFIRRHIHKAVDELDERKMNILNRNISDEISKVKKLRMAGETEQKFEAWRKDWDEIIETILPSIEEQLLEVEEFAGKYRIRKAKDQLSWVENRMVTVEQQLDMMVEDIEHLVSAEKKNRAEITDIKQTYHKLSGDLLKRRGSFGEAIQALDAVMAKVKRTLVSFEESTENGSYLQARKQLLEMTNELEEVNAKMERLPQLLIQARSTLPSDLKNLQSGIKHMEEDGYHLTSFSFGTRIEQFNEDVEGAYELLKELQVDEAAATLEAVHTGMEQIYENLEAEVTYKNKLHEQLPVLKEKVGKASEMMQQLLHETTHVQKSYLIAEEETHLQHALQKDLTQAQSQLNVIVDVAENQKQTFSSIYEMCEEWLKYMDQLTNGIAESVNRLKRLRKDELKAKDTVSRLREVMLETKRILHKSNLPGVPVTHLESLDKAENKVVQAQEALRQLPLEMESVEKLVEEAILEVEKNAEEIKAIVEKAQLAELSIQYSNRYRMQDDSVRTALDEAEEAFLRYEYEYALELVQAAVRDYEPDLLNKVTKHMSA